MEIIVIGLAICHSHSSHALKLGPKLTSPFLSIYLSDQQLRVMLLIAAYYCLSSGGCVRFGQSGFGGLTDTNGVSC